MSDWPMKSSDIKVLTRMHLQRIKDKKEEETVTTPPLKLKLQMRHQQRQMMPTGNENASVRGQ